MEIFYIQILQMEIFYIQILQMEFSTLSLILFASKYFRSICWGRNEHILINQHTKWWEHVNNHFQFVFKLNFRHWLDSFHLCAKPSFLNLTAQRRHINMFLCVAFPLLIFLPIVLSTISTTTEKVTPCWPEETRKCHYRKNNTRIPPGIIITQSLSQASQFFPLSK